jgi:iron complex transport system substrate-binding protein
MYGKTEMSFPERIVCLTAETAEIVSLLGAGDRLVGVPGTARHPPQVREKAKVGGFTTFRLDKILALHPDLVLAFSDLQAGIVRELIESGVPVFATNQRSFHDILRTILMVGGLIGKEPEAQSLIQDMQDEVRQVREFSSVWPDRPRVYFEEWDDPPISGIRWVSDLIEIAGGRDIFPELRDRGRAPGRVVDPAEVARRNPQIIVASWCGKKLDPEKLRQRPGWDRLEAIRANRIYEIDGLDILAPGPSVMRGLRRLHEIIQAVVASG